MKRVVCMVLDLNMFSLVTVILSEYLPSGSMASF